MPKLTKAELDPPVSAIDVDEFGNEMGCFSKIRAIRPVYWGMYGLTTALTAGGVAYVEMENLQREWHLLIAYGFVCILLAVGDGTPRDFFKPIDESDTQGNQIKSFFLLAMTSFVSWVMAKSIQNSSKLGARFGVVGGLAYGAWYVGVLCSGIVIYLLRRQGYHSLPDFIHDRYGPLACLVFLGVVLYRLFNEVWSNTIVIADFFGESLSNDWVAAAWVSAAIPAVYTAIGGMRASLHSDALQAVLMCALLALTYLTITQDIVDNEPLRAYAKANHDSDSLWFYNPVKGREMWSLEGGMDLFCVGIMQGALSYTFMDPALTDRAFLASKEVMIAGFAFGALVAVAYITVFGFIGVYGNMLASCVAAGECDEKDLRGASMAAVSAGEPSAVGTVLGPNYYTLLCLVIITSALSTLDSTFSAVAKAVGPDLHGFLTTGRPINPSDATEFELLLGRVGILVIAVTGTLPLLFDPDELSATTVTGTMVPGLGPPIYMAAFATLASPLFCGRAAGYKKRPLLFLLPFLYSASLGTVYQMQSQDVNCKPYKLSSCVLPPWSPASSADACGAYGAYFDCVAGSGCWKKSDLNSCLSFEAANGMCPLDCHAGAVNNKPFDTIVDLSGFDMGNGPYANLLGINAVSAIGALFLFLFACCDDPLEWKLGPLEQKANEEEDVGFKEDTEAYETNL